MLFTRTLNGKEETVDIKLPAYYRAGNSYYRINKNGSVIKAFVLGNYMGLITAGINEGKTLIETAVNGVSCSKKEVDAAIKDALRVSEDILNDMREEEACGELHPVMKQALQPFLNR